MSFSRLTAPALFLAATMFSSATVRAAPAPDASVPQTAQPSVAPAVARPVPDSFADLAARLLPAVVNISTTATISDDEDEDEGEDEGPQVPDFPKGSPFEKFFHDFMNRKKTPDGQPHKMQALGSGFIIDASGIVVTNNHVVRHADKVTVTLQDNTVLPAKVIGHDERTDLAVLKVTSPKPLPFVSFGDSDRDRVGDWVLAIGNPFGLSGTVTAGIISSRGRNIDQGPYDDFIQTDASINRGNSGGPLFDLRGDVIGVNTAIYSPSGGSVGIGFSIPSNEAAGIIEQLRKTGKVSRGWIGVRIQDVTQDIADGLNLKPAGGALVAGIEPGGPAAKAKLQTGDVIRTLNGKTVEGKALPRLIAQIPVGTKATLGVWRHGKMQDMTIVIEALPEPKEKKSSDHNPAPHADSKAVTLKALGLSVSPLTDELRDKYKIAAGQNGVVVSDVAADGVAADRGLHPGDLITEVQQEEVSSPSVLQTKIEAARKAGKHSVLLLVRDSDGTRWVPLPLEK
ncbi:DegQ family serine endoprotease [Acetobacter sp. AN02]|uniref:DegQ family serine endoprotease n=1 Tax=Acetobacter sp. AN02 TaxID=2894186 RepID=UPI00243440A5|nr:DegQ family serine endoprotease [Acetobacter sp. AN02]MDG6095341.1 DegQ family serine endoprotease [Acetobacter sp. AN02]